MYRTDTTDTAAFFSVLLSDRAFVSTSQKKSTRPPKPRRMLCCHAHVVSSPKQKSPSHTWKYSPFPHQPPTTSSKSPENRCQPQAFFSPARCSPSSPARSPAWRYSCRTWPCSAPWGSALRRTRGSARAGTPPVIREFDCEHSIEVDGGNLCRGMLVQVG